MYADMIGIAKYYTLVVNFAIWGYHKEMDIL